MEIFGIVCAAAILIVGIVLYNTFVWGLILFKFYNWFLLPLFTALPVITFWQAVGLTFIICLFHGKNYTTIKKEYRDNTNTLVSFFIGPWLTLLVGYIFYCIIY